MGAYTVNCQNKITLKRCKIVAKRSGDTLAFKATVYFNDTLVGHASSEGDGGPTDVHIEEEWQRQVNEYVDSLPAVIYAFDGLKPYERKPELEGIVDELAVAEDYKRQMTNKARRAILIKTKDCGEGEFYRWGVKDRLDRYKHTVALRKKYKGAIVEIWGALDKAPVVK